MTVGIVMLAHRALDRAASVALHLARQGAPVVIHVDRRTPERAFADLAAAVTSERRVALAPRVASEWGTWGLVEATVSGCRLLLTREPEVTHVALISGDSLPLRPLAALDAHLAEHPDTDFIESVAIRDVSWAMDGLEEERFTLSFPFAWKRRRRAFDAWVEVQRRLGVSRRPPSGLEPHMGAQWWSLTARTLRAILDDPEFDRIARFFRRVWIPDESFFQTMARRHARHVVSASPTFARFGYRGRPHLFYDDHLPLLMASDAFFARKIWPGARELYGHFLGPAAGRIEADGAIRPEHRLQQSVDRRSHGRPGLVMAGRHPAPHLGLPPTAAGYTVLHGFSDLYADLRGWLSRALPDRVHGHLFAPEVAEFADGADTGPGNLSAASTLRDYDPAGFLRNLVWATRGEPQVFLTRAGETGDLAGVLAPDPNAEVFAITGAWVLALEGSDADMRADAARWQRSEADMLAVYQSRWTRARVRVWSLADAVADPTAPLTALLGRRPARPVRPAGLAETVDLSALAPRIDWLRRQGLAPHVAGNVDEVLRAKTRQESVG